MNVTKEEFDEKCREAVDTLLVAMADHAEINPEKFYSMACMLENLAFFSPVIYGVLQKSGKKDPTD